VRVFVVDDDLEIRDGLQKLFALEGHEVRVAIDGRDALSQLESGFLPHVIVSDLMMPVMDGASFIRELAASPAWRSIPVVVFSAWVDDEWRGPKPFAVLRKPLDFDRLLGTVAQAADRAARSEPPQGAWGV
jgi:two-component system, chemotaxis family, chemotaxis protein CheY